ncbi:tetratricopeptide repeat protein [Planctomycetaceae bacterium SH139]
MKALAMEPTRRYESAIGFAEDIERYLNFKPVEARPPSVSYRMTKFVRKNRTVVFAASLLLIGVQVGIAGLVLGIIKASKEAEKARIAQTNAESSANLAVEARIQAETAEQLKADALLAERQERQNAETLLEFVTRDILAMTSVAGQLQFDRSGTLSLTKDSTLRDVLDRAASRMASRGTLTAEMLAELNWVIGFSYRGLGESEKAINFLNKSYEQRKTLLGESHVKTLEALSTLATAHDFAGQTELSLPMHLRVIELADAALDNADPTRLLAMDGISQAFQLAGRFEEALAIRQQVIEIRQHELGEFDRQTFLSKVGLASLHREIGDPAKAVHELKLLGQRMTEEFGVDDPDRLLAMSELGRSMLRTGEFEEALSLLEKVSVLQKLRLGEDHPYSLIAINDLAGAMQVAGKPLEAVALYQKTLELVNEKFGITHQTSLMFKSNLGQSLIEAKRPKDAIPILAEVLGAQRAKLGNNHPGTIKTLMNLGGAALSTGDIEAAGEHFQIAVEAFENTLGKDHFGTLSAKNNLTAVYDAQERYEQAAELYNEVALELSRQLGPENMNVAMVKGNLAISYAAAGKTQMAIEVLEEVCELSEDIPQVAGAGAKLAGVYIAAEMHEQARELAEDMIRRAMPKKRDIPSLTEAARVLRSHGAGLLEAKAYLPAQRVLEKACEICAEIQPENWIMYDTQSMLGEALLYSQPPKSNNQEAEELEDVIQNSSLPAREVGEYLRNSYDGLIRTSESIPQAYRKQILMDSADRLYAWATAMKDSDEMAKWQRVSESFK